jgi:hypothetical protein
MKAAAQTAFSELDASRLYQRLVNELDPEPFIARLAPNVHYCSHWVIEDLDDYESVAKLLRGKIDTIRSTGNAQNDAIIGVATGYCRGMPLVVLVDKISHKPEATVSFEIVGGLITHVWICVLGAYVVASLHGRPLSIPPATPCVPWEWRAMRVPYGWCENICLFALPKIPTSRIELFQQQRVILHRLGHEVLHTIVALHHAVDGEES